METPGNPASISLKRRPWGRLDPVLRSALVHFSPPASAVYWGVAAAARDEAVREVLGRRLGDGRPLAQEALVQRLVGLMEHKLKAAWWSLLGALDELGPDYQPDDRAVSLVQAAKRTVVTEAVEVVDLALQAVGGASYFKRSPLEQAYRDVRAGEYHPMTPEVTLLYLACLCRMAEEVRLPAGQVLFVEGSLADRAYVLYEGELEIVKHLDGREVLIDVQRVPGTVIGEMALLEETTRLATVRASRDSVLLGLSHREVNELFNLNPGAAKIMLRTLMGRWRALETQVRLSEKMAQLGTFTAGIAHELNNPAAAVLRGAGQLQELLDAAIRAHAALERLGLSQQQQARVEALERQVRERVASPLALDPLSRSDREEELEAWLEGRGQRPVREFLFGGEERQNHSQPR